MARPVKSVYRAPSENVAKRVVRELTGTYGLPRHGNPADPVDDLVYIILSNRANIEAAQEILLQLRRLFPSWKDALSDEKTLQETIRPLGLARKRAASLLSIFRRLIHDFGRVELEKLRDYSDSEIEKYLCSLAGVSVKVARCVMMYSFGRDVLPVDVHVHRITRRLGWHDRKRADQVHSRLDEIVPRGARLAFHVTCIAHGRSVCRSSNPLCNVCVISWACATRNESRRPAEKLLRSIRSKS